MKIEFEVPDFVDGFSITYDELKGGRLSFRATENNRVYKEDRVVSPMGMRLPIVVNESIKLTIERLKETILNDEVL